jgi:hypothetical protein
MERIPKPGEGPAEPAPVPGEDVREPPLPSDHDRERFPGNDEVPDPDVREPDEGGEGIKKRLS